MIKFWFDKYRNKRASHRIRALRPVEGLKSLGHDADIINDKSIDRLSKDDIVIFTKDTDPGQMLKLKQQGYTVGFDICDNKFKEARENYTVYCREADFITCNTEFQQKETLKYTGRHSHVYIDPIERNIEPHQRSTCDPVELVWYGGSASLKYVGFGDIIPYLNRSGINLRLTIITNDAQEKVHHLTEMGNVVYHEWSYELQEAKVRNSDIVFIPMTIGKAHLSRRTITKSPNRLLDGIAQGKWVVASPVPSYQQASKFCWLDDYLEGIRFYLEQPSTVQEKIYKGQEWIRQHHSKEVCAQQLIDIYKKVKS
ncbi:MAG: glycosyltransferase family 1 protein [Euryarchaeota archaeon]|jgi:hypothetical protein|nr:glycosyltransferase family 1 protein [Euryarchaeota archaeon]